MHADGEAAENEFVGSRSQVQKEGADIFFPFARGFGPLGASEKDCAWAAENLVTRLLVDQLCVETGRFLSCGKPQCKRQMAM
jgi:hypothetical protein